MKKIDYIDKLNFKYQSLLKKITNMDIICVTINIK